MANKSVISRSIDQLRFPCAAAVVLLHALGQPLAGNDGISFRYGAYDATRILFSEGMCRVAVPIFFFISGYLFFVKLEQWNINVWVDKLRKRAKTLLVPYLLWNIIAFLLLVAIECGKLIIKNTPPSSMIYKPSITMLAVYICSGMQSQGILLTYLSGL